MALPFVKSSIIKAPHGFFGRRGGVSTGYFESLNAGLLVGDDIKSVNKNRALIADTLGFASKKIFSTKQVHGTLCVAPGLTGVEADAMVTTEEGVPLGILTADCAPVLFYADGVVGAAHAGWGGALKGVLESTILAMKGQGAKNIAAAIGPCIGPDSYEVSDGFEKPFLAEDRDAMQFFKSGAGGGLMFDLPGYCAWRLRRAGIETVETIGHDTLTMEEAYFSHRRSTKRKEPKRGLQLSVISLKRP